MSENEDEHKIAQDAILALLQDLEEIPREIVSALATTKILHEDSPISYNPRFPNRCDCKDCYFARLVDKFVNNSFRLLLADTQGGEN